MLPAHCWATGHVQVTRGHAVITPLFTSLLPFRQMVASAAAGSLESGIPKCLWGTFAGGKKKKVPLTGSTPVVDGRWQAPKVIPWSFAWPTRAVVARSMAVHPQVHDISGGRWSGYSQVGVNRVPVGHRSPDLAGLLLHTPHPCPPAAS